MVDEASHEVAIKYSPYLRRQQKKMERKQMKIKLLGTLLCQSNHKI
jgi:hypothetical protein